MRIPARSRAHAVSHDDPQHRNVLELGRHRIRRDQPASGTQCFGHVVDGVAAIAGHLEGDDRDPGLRETSSNWSIATTWSAIQAAVSQQALLDALVSVATEAQEHVVLSDDLGTRPREVESEGRHVTAQILDVEDEILRQGVVVAAR